MSDQSGRVLSCRYGTYDVVKQGRYCYEHECWTLAAQEYACPPKCWVCGPDHDDERHRALITQGVADWRAENAASGRTPSSKRQPVTDDIVWCDTCENYHLPNQHDLFSPEARRMAEGVLAGDHEAVAEVLAEPVEGRTHSHDWLLRGTVGCPGWECLTCGEQSLTDPTSGRTTSRPRWRLRLARLIYPWWTEAEIDAAKWRAHQTRRDLGLVECVETTPASNPSTITKETP